VAKRKVRVINRGKRIRDRLGSRFLPNQPQELEVNSRQYLTLKAVKDFKVEIIEDEKKEENNLEGNSTDTVIIDEHNDIDSENDSNINNKVVTKEETQEDTQENAEYTVSDEEVDYYDLNIEEVLKAVEEGVFDVDEAIAYEVAGKNRVTLLEKLEEIKAQDE